MELLTAAALSAVIALALLGATRTALEFAHRSRDRLVAEDAAERIFEQLELDLAGARWRDDGRTWLAATIQTDSARSGRWLEGGKPAEGSLRIDGSDLSGARFGVAGTWLRFFSGRRGSHSRTGAKGAPAVVGYQLIRRPGAAGEEDGRYFFFRTESTAEAASEAGYDLDAAAYLTSDDRDGAVGNVVSPRDGQVLAENVIDFGVELHGWRTGSAGRSDLVQLFPRDEGGLEYRAGSPTADGATAAMPAVADVMVRMVSESGASRLAALESGRMNGEWWTVAEAHSFVFTRRILLHAAGS